MAKYMLLVSKRQPTHCKSLCRFVLSSILPSPISLGRLAPIVVRSVLPASPAQLRLLPSPAPLAHFLAPSCSSPSCAREPSAQSAAVSACWCTHEKLHQP